MSWKERYAAKLISADDAARFVKSGDRVRSAMCSPFQTPIAFVTALARRAAELRDVDIDVTWSAASELGLLAPGTEDAWSTYSAFAYGRTEEERLTQRSPQTNFVPLHPSFIGRLGRGNHRDDFRQRWRDADVYAVMVTPPDAAGNVTFGFNLWNARVQMDGARIIIGEVNERLPIVPGGDNWAPADAFDYFIETIDMPMPSTSLDETPEEEREASEVCAALMAELIDNGDTVMFGGGAMPIRFQPFLEHKEDLGCHSEVVVPLDLMRKGVITNKKRNLAPGQVSCTAISAWYGQADLDYIHLNPRFDMRDMAVNNDPRYICQNDRLVAVNAPLEITLWGEINVERVGPRYLRGVGGQVEFVMGALLSEGGRSIHGVVSRKKNANGEWVSAIVPEFTHPGVASIPRHLADFVVTEHGVARLMGKTERERANELIAIAHPDFRPELREAAKRFFGLGKTIHFT
ncbi:MAG TPA: acetyl-CoA hydrolase/transferase C-terminal domain-containing protein [Dehalococcoidia bacterium]|nr:acetyl-CoA hydrolase/transferase C-terminal domain-containing protein [Dehalococcoidia bacterium]